MAAFFYRELKGTVKTVTIRGKKFIGEFFVYFLDIEMLSDPYSRQVKGLDFGLLFF